MPATPNILIQTAAQAKAQAASAKPSVVAAGPGDKASSFAQVFADQGQNKPSVTTDNSVKPARDKDTGNVSKKDTGKDPCRMAMCACTCRSVRKARVVV